jgi:probable rRNA maturation factor
LRTLLEDATGDLGLVGWSVSCQLTTDRVLRGLNRRFAGLDHPTDVLAFPVADLAPGSGFQLPPDPLALLGDIFIAVPLAMTQALEAGENPVQALRLLAVHGLLHLVGHDHHESRQAAQMTQATRQLLSRHAARRGELPPTVAPLHPSA